MIKYVMMQIDGKEVRCDLSAPLDISLHISGEEAPNAFWLPKAEFNAFRMGSFVGSIEEGGPVRCDVVTLAPHGNGTHTECVGHIAGKKFLITECMTDVLDLATVVTIPLELVGGDMVVTKAALDAAWTDRSCSTLIIRTMPNDSTKCDRVWSGHNPPYMHIDAMRLMVEHNIRHLMIDLPSVDREEDSGALVAHHEFWQWPHAPRTECTITELIYVSNDIQDGRYLVMFNVAPFDGDAAPSRPMLFFPS